VPWGKPEVRVEHKLLKTGVMPVPTPMPKFDPAEINPAGLNQSGLSRRTWIGLILLTVSTVGTLALAWVWPDLTQVHFWLVAQALPIFYWLLVWWWARQPAMDSHEH
jgi:hypothetical protein